MCVGWVGGGDREEVGVSLGLVSGGGGGGGQFWGGQRGQRQYIYIGKCFYEYELYKFLNLIEI